MSRSDPYVLGEEFTRQISRFQRPVFLLAHHDDEIPTSGLLQRLGPGKRVVWVTNSDGLYTESDRTPQEYGSLRMAEGARSVSLAGVPDSSVTQLGFSEVEIYRRFAWLHGRKKRIDEVRPFFQEIRDRIRQTLLEIEPDAVFTLAWQGGQPEHDLTHFFGMLALGDLERRTGTRPAFFHMPAYEYMILVAMRFHPLYRGTRIRLRLSPEELQVKKTMIQCYPSQVRLFGDFQRIFRWTGMAGYLSGGPRSVEEFLSIEEFGPVPADLDYSRKPHALDFFTYMFDDFEGTPVTFSTSIRPIVQEFLRDPG
ncbi:PIG-L family deacetylase [Myxococcota bacterium]|nr:PIG-L family deacetylase [Myxococcota bacterium]